MCLLSESWVELPRLYLGWPKRESCARWVHSVHSDLLLGLESVTWCFGLLANGQWPIACAADVTYKHTNLWYPTTAKDHSQFTYLRAAVFFSPNEFSHPYPLRYTPLQYFNLDKPHCVHFIYTRSSSFQFHVSADRNMLSFVFPRTLSLARVGSLSSFRRACDGAGRMMVLRVLDFHLAVSRPWRCVWQAIGHHS